MSDLVAKFISTIGLILGLIILWIAYETQFMPLVAVAVIAWVATEYTGGGG